MPLAMQAAYLPCAKTRAVLVPTPLVLSLGSLMFPSKKYGHSACELQATCSVTLVTVLPLVQAFACNLHVYQSTSFPRLHHFTHPLKVRQVTVAPIVPASPTPCVPATAVYTGPASSADSRT